MIKKHVFISGNGTMLSGWKQAFPKAEVFKTDALPDLAYAEFIWLRLQSGQTLLQQIQNIGDIATKARLIILSDTPSDQEAMAAFSQSARGYANTHAGFQTLKCNGMEVLTQ